MRTKIWKIKSCFTKKVLTSYHYLQTHHCQDLLMCLNFFVSELHKAWKFCTKSPATSMIHPPVFQFSIFNGLDNSQGPFCGDDFKTLGCGATNNKPKKPSERMGMHIMQRMRSTINGTTILEALWLIAMRESNANEMFEFFPKISIISSIIF